MVSEGDPFLTSNGCTLYFFRLSTMGDRDISRHVFAVSLGAHQICTQPRDARRTRVGSPILTSMRSPRQPWFWLSMVVVCLGCEATERGLEWEVVFGSGVDSTRAVRVETRIFRGGCSSAMQVYFAPVERLAPVGAQPPTLSPGVYGFDAIALDDECVAYAAGCVEQNLPQADGERVTVTLTPTPVEFRRCPPAVCARGACVGDVEDAGFDTSTAVDSATGDTAVDTGDGGRLCSAADLAAETGCPAGQHCAIEYTDAGPVFRCFDDGVGTQASLCTDASSCASGYGCEPTGFDGEPPNVCTRYCRDDAECGADPRAQCLIELGVGFCSTACDPTTTDVCPPGTKCNFSFEGDTWCGLAGTGEFEDACDTHDDCAPGYGCADDGSGGGVCLQNCVLGAGDCPGGFRCYAESMLYGVCDLS
jgi:hypothetical protein